MQETSSYTSPHNDKNLWDEMLKAIVDIMPEQLFPLFKEVYGKDYSRGTPIRLLSTEYSTFEENTGIPPSSRLMDIALLVNDTDYYHIECQMKNDDHMVIRMISYDLRFAVQHCTHRDSLTGEIILRFPHSVVLYPDANKSLPDSLECRILFQDGSEHIYQIPTVKIQSYSLEEIRQKHLNLFLPYALLRLKPRIESARPLTAKELTDFVTSLIVILEEELSQGYMNERELKDYVNLIQCASAKIFANYPEYNEEVLKVTKSTIILPSQLRDIIERHKKELAEKDEQLAEQDERLAQQLAEKDAEIIKLREQLALAGVAVGHADQ